MQFFVPEVFTLKNCLASDSTIKSALEQREDFEGLVPKVPHWRQKFYWDCGIACAYMILRYYGSQLSANELYEKFWTQSVWTIDLVHLLHSFGLELTYYTVTWGVRKEYCKQEFYRPHFQEDKVRVQRLFGLAKSQNLSIVKESVSLEKLKQQLARGCLLRNYPNNIDYQSHVEKGELVLLLVDKRLLRCSLCQPKVSFMGWLKKLCNPGFLGHYIVLWGYCPRRDSFWYSDPASCQGFCTIRSEVLELCRKSQGTDEDLVIVRGFRKPSRQ